MIISDENKVFDVYFNGSMSNDSYGIQRNIIVNQIEKSNFTHSELIKRVSTKDYFINLKKSKVCISPFGYGEICYRDFEIIKSGSLLCKPNMNHLLTYPNFYVPFITYVPFEWNIEDFNYNISKILKNESDYYRIKNNAQKLLKEFYTDEGKVKFVNHVLKSIDIYEE